MLILCKRVVALYHNFISVQIRFFCFHPHFTLSSGSFIPFKNHLAEWQKNIVVCLQTFTVNSGYLKVNFKLMISQSKLSGPRKFTLRYQKFELKGVEMQREKRNVPTILFDIRNLEISVFEISRVDCV